ncbi:hypothetical protein [Natronoflexus pectinivorans]|uniref:Lactobin A/cerein 7B family class IIb bacteriocin n=1 Tax=Natronoflexus pectinivorans TaxID=682526 RepID=A0A4R2GID9_9BACT|nr:hypothetical protein [Natronoflexus pectinivorans]TCO08327.1 hypothetical protein EV194_105131 [Natronoflexus pectinivorans]
MNNLELKELSVQEMKEANGGFALSLLLWVVSTMAVSSIDNPDDFWEGYHSVRK